MNASDHQSRSLILRRARHVLVVAACIAISMVAAFGALAVFFQSWEYADRAVIALVVLPAIAALGIVFLLAFVIALERKPHRAMYVVAGLGSVLAITGTIAGISAAIANFNAWFQWIEPLKEMAVIAFATACALAYTAVMALARQQPVVIRFMASATVICAWLATSSVCATIISYRVTGDFDQQIMLLVITIVTYLVLLVCTAAVAIAIISKVARRRTISESIGQRVALRMECPRCSGRQTCKPGHSRCTHCGTGLFIEIEEPRCVCGYLLFRLTNPTCPECGRALTGVTAAMLQAAAPGAS